MPFKIIDTVHAWTIIRDITWWTMRVVPLIVDPYYSKSWSFNLTLNAAGWAWYFCSHIQFLRAAPDLMIQACMSGDADTVKRLLEAHAKANRADNDGNTPLSMACSFANSATVKLLLDAGANVNQENPLGQTALHFASGNGKKGNVELLLKLKGVDVNYIDGDGKTPLHWACHNGHSDIVELLINNGANVRLADKKDVTPLQLAKKNEVLLNTIKTFEKSRLLKRIKKLSNVLPVAGPCYLVVEYISSDVLESKEIRAIVNDGFKSQEKTQKLDQLLMQEKV